jgi:predicted AlkP superfamily pyrophosphatase or phosphodiesterase
MSTKRIIVVIAVLSAFLTLTPASAGQSERPKLVLEIIVDQLRGDMPSMVLERNGSGGFRYLAENGAWYKNAHHSHANTETIVGHTTISTGAYPSRHGMVGNVWFDSKLDRLVYNIEDPDYAATGGLGARDMDAEVDSTQVSKTEGRSPRTIITTTLSDELSLTYGSQSRIYAVSGKDRGAVAMAGHMGKAFWYSTNNGQFASSTYYFDEFPDWVVAWNQQKQADKYYGKHWALSKPLSTYRYAAQDDRPYENPQDLGYGRVFPHPFGDVDNRYFYTLLMASPVVDELTVDFAKTLIQEEKLGQDNIPDFLAISLSSTDYVGHLFGPASLESEENLLRLDRTLDDLLTFIDREIGLESTLIVLSSDHGTPEASQYMAEKGMHTGVLDLDAVDYSGMDAKLNSRFGIGKEVIRMTFHPYVYLDHNLIRQHDLNLEDVSRLVAGELSKVNGIAFAIPSIDLASGHLPDASPIIRQVLHNYNPERSGDIYMIYEPHWGTTFTGDVAVVNHGSPWTYDTLVPIIFAGWGIPAGKVYRRVETVDIAPTLALLLETKLPSGSVGQPLQEVLVSESALNITQ